MLICSSIVFEFLNSRFPIKGWKDGITRWSEPQACAKLQKSALSRQSTFSHYKLNHYNQYITMKIFKPINTLDKFIIGHYSIYRRSSFIGKILNHGSRRAIYRHEESIYVTRDQNVCIRRNKVTTRWEGPQSLSYHKKDKSVTSNTFY